MQVGINIGVHNVHTPRQLHINCLKPEHNKVLSSIKVNKPCHGNLSTV